MGKIGQLFSPPVILSVAKDLLYMPLKRPKQILRSAQDDISVVELAFMVTGLRAIQKTPCAHATIVQNSSQRKTLRESPYPSHY
jgi:hypothetical protein